MLESVRCVNYRGFEDFTVSGLGRVNLVIGTNNCGKSSWLGACLSRGVSFVVLPWAMAPWGQREYASRSRWWRPLFREGDEERGLSIEVERVSGARSCLTLTPMPPAAAIVTEVGEWWYQAELTGAVQAKARFRWEGERLLANNAWSGGVGGMWSTPNRELCEQDRSRVEELSLNGQLEDIVEPLRRFDERIDGVELIGEEVVVRLRGLRRRLPLHVIGDGAFRVLDIVLSRSNPAIETWCLDELDAGLHHSTLASVWKLLQESRPDLQIFATTHRDESVLAAAQCFVEAKDDSLRVIRIDRRDAGHRAVIYSAEQAQHAIESGWEVRG